MKNIVFPGTTIGLVIPAVVRKMPKAFITPEFVCATEKGIS